MQRTTARGRLDEEPGLVMFPVDVSGLSEESGRRGLEALREAVVGRKRVETGGGGQCAAETE